MPGETDQGLFSLDKAPTIDERASPPKSNLVNQGAWEQCGCLKNTSITKKFQGSIGADITEAELLNVALSQPYLVPGYPGTTQAAGRQDGTMTRDPGEGPPMPLLLLVNITADLGITVPSFAAMTVDPKL